MNIIAATALALHLGGFLLVCSTFLIRQKKGRKYAWPYLIAPIGLTMQLFAGVLLAAALVNGTR